MNPEEDPRRRNLEASQLRTQARQHEQEADRLERDSTRQDIPQDEHQSLRHDASVQRSQATDLNQRAADLVQHHQNEPAELARADQDRARQWYLSGTANPDAQMQLVEANQNGGLLQQLGSYALRSATTERNGAAWNATKNVAAGAGRALTGNTRADANEKAAGLVQQHAPDSNAHQAPERQQGIAR